MKIFLVWKNSGLAFRDFTLMKGFKTLEAAEKYAEKLNSEIPEEERVETDEYGYVCGDIYEVEEMEVE